MHRIKYKSTADTTEAIFAIPSDPEESEDNLESASDTEDVPFHEDVVRDASEV